jgi:tRNA pseudouridine55 synthase
MNTTDLSGFLLINKESGKTSFQIIAELRKILNIKKIGHSGTLDKNASGLLLIAFGKATKLIKFLVGLPKTYIAEFHFGTQTTTDDINGEVVNRYEGIIDPDVIRSFIPEFTGNIRQIPPDFSAIHVNGQRAYKISLSNQKPVMKEKEVEIKKFEITGLKVPVMNALIECTSGTYIRSIARDIGIRTEYYCHLSGLKRLKVGMFDIGNSLHANMVEPGSLPVLSPFEVLCDLAPLRIKEDHLKQLVNGIKIENDWFEDDDPHSGRAEKHYHEGYYKVHHSGKLLAVIKYSNGNFSYDLVY